MPCASGNAAEGSYKPAVIKYLDPRDKGRKKETMKNDNKTILKNVQEATTNIADSISMVIPLDGKEIILTHDCEGGNLIVKNWLDIDGNNLTEFISTLMQLKTSVREELFDRTIEAIEKQDKEVTELLNKIKEMGWYDEFAVYSRAD